MTNVVLVHTHDTGRYIEPYGYDVPTPTLRQLAEEGVLFRRAYCAAPTCSPSRGALMTGQAPHSNGLIGLAHRGFSLEMDDHHLANYLSRNGFETVLCGVEHESSRDGGPSDLGYRRVPSDPGAGTATGDRFDAPHDRAERDYATARAAAAYVRESAGRDRERPFFLSVGFHNTHRPFPLDEPTVDPRYVRPPEPIPDVPTTRDDMAGFVTAAGFVDDCVGHVLDALRESGTLEETLVVFTTDHGPAFPRMKCTLREGGTGVSLVVRFPDRWRGRVYDGLVSHVDLYPTLCEYLGLETPAWVQGNSILPALEGERETVRDEVFGEVTYHAAYEPQRCIRTERYTYVRRFDDEFDATVLPNVDDGPTKRFLLELEDERDLGDRTNPREALYDRFHDPNERENLVLLDDPVYDEVREDLAARLAAWMCDTDDPLLDGPVSKPDGARADRRDGVHPDEAFEASDAR